MPGCRYRYTDDDRRAARNASAQLRSAGLHFLCAAHALLGTALLGGAAGGGGADEATLVRAMEQLADPPAALGALAPLWAEVRHSIA